MKVNTLVKHFEVDNPQINYQDLRHLKSINGVKFTVREIDVIACLLSGKGSKAIANLLSIEEKTVETHKYNIMRKLECNAKEGIIRFVEQSGKFTAFKNHYVVLLVRNIFEKYLKQIKLLNRGKDISCLVVYENYKNKAHFVDQLEKALTNAGIKVFNSDSERNNSFKNLQDYINSKSIDSIIYLASEEFIQKLRRNDREATLKIDQLKTIINHTTYKSFILFQIEGSLMDLPQEINNVRYIHFEQEEKYVFNLLEILKALLRDLDLDRIIWDFKKECENIYDSPQNSFPHFWFQIQNMLKKRTFYRFFPHNVSSGFKKLVLCGGVLIVSGTYLWVYLDKSNNPKVDQLPQRQEIKKIRSDLPIPTDKTLLKRRNFMDQIEAFMNSNNGIKTVALVGIGGSGKTTIAHQYAVAQNLPVVWEINAETDSGLIKSFENLATALSQTKEEESILKGYATIKNLEERRDKIISFVKERLKLQAEWLLIFDNVEKFSSLQRYFPSDPENWGNGRVIITTRDSNIKNNKYVNNVIFIGNLDDREKYILFTNIIKRSDAQQFTYEQERGILKFLKELPPFPLDISIAGYYLKVTNITYDDYLNHLKVHDNNFELIQEALLKEAGDYTKTRFGIITLSLQEIIKNHKDFGNLLLLINLLESQNIPRKLLDIYRNNIVVDYFIYSLKNYSLITHETLASHNGISVLSFHRITHHISRLYFSRLFNKDIKEVALQAMKVFCENKQCIPKEWESIDNVNNYIPFVPHFESLCRFAERLGVRNLHLFTLLSSLFEYQLYILQDIQACKQYIERIDSLMKSLSTLNEDVLVKYLINKLYLIYIYDDMDVVLNIIHDIKARLKTLSNENKFRLTISLIQTQLFYGDLTEAEKLIKDAEKILDQDNVINRHYLGLYQFSRAWLHREQNQLVNALEFSDKAIKNLDSHFPKTSLYYFALNMKSEVLIYLGRPAEALKIAEFSLNNSTYDLKRLKNTHNQITHFIAEANYLIGRSKFELGRDLDEAKRDIEQSIKLHFAYFQGQRHPDQARPYITLGDIYHTTEKFKEARVAYLEADKILDKICSKKQTATHKELYEKIIKNELSVKNYQSVVISKYSKLLKEVFGQEHSLLVNKT